ncbi:MAG: hypothetical protein H8E34_10185 [Bacteroidetes bacterium]|nr:hypothetical protein [Bacteroidota bacterium]MBL6944497.1 hypothetical protein [Bacteroidales bacterium]
MKHLNSKRLTYLIYMFSVIVVIFLIFNIIITYLIHSQLGEMASKPGRWPAGSYIYDKEIGFDFAPCISDYIQDSSFYVKSHQMGYRIGENEDAVSFRPGGILSLGCSLTYGDEVDSEETFTQVIADSLEIPAYNYGISSFSYVHALLKAQKLKDEGLLDKLKPKYIILGCWQGLLNRSRTPFPPIASKNVPLTAAYLAKDESGIKINYPLSTRHVFELVTMYRKEGTDLSLRKFVKIFMSVPRFVYIYLKNNRLFQKMRDIKSSNKVSDFDVYDFYFTGIENLFSASQAKIIVLFMPNNAKDQPDEDLFKALAKHPDITFINGLRAVKKYGVSTHDYQGKHPQPAAHRAYALETLSRIK